MEPVPPALESGFLTTGLPEKPLSNLKTINSNRGMDPSRCLNSLDGGGSGILYRNGTYRNEQNAEQMGSHNSLKGSQGVSLWLPGTLPKEPLLPLAL